MAFNKSLDNVKKICKIVTEEKTDAAMISSIVQLACDKIEKWISIEPDEFFDMDDLEEKLETIDQDIDEFFDRYGKDLAKEFKMTLDKFMDFVSKNRATICKNIANSL